MERMKVKNFSIYEVTYLYAHVSILHTITSTRYWKKMDILKQNKLLFCSDNLLFISYPVTVDSHYYEH